MYPAKRKQIVRVLEFKHLFFILRRTGIRRTALLWYNQCCHGKPIVFLGSRGEGALVQQKATTSG